MQNDWDESEPQPLPKKQKKKKEALVETRQSINREEIKDVYQDSQASLQAEV